MKQNMVVSGISGGRLFAWVAMALLLGVLGFTLWPQKPSSPPEPSAPVETASPASEPEVTPRQDPLPEDTFEADAVSARPDVAGSSIAPQTAARPLLPEAPTTVLPEDLTLRLSEIAGKELAAAGQVEEINEILGYLVSLGETGIPAITEFLASEANVDFGGKEDSIRHQSLRLALFDVLRQIGGLDAEDVMLTELEATGNPLEIATLVRYLDEQVPGAYRQDAMRAAQKTLRSKSKGRVSAGEIGPLFQVLQDYGDGSVVPELEGHREKWGYYATIAMAGLGSGEGLSTLIERVDRRLEEIKDNPVNEHAILSDEDLFALQMLAQVAIDQPNAQSALLDQANRIPESLWPKLASALSGSYQFQAVKPEAEDSVEGYPHTTVKNGQILYIRNRYGTDPVSSEEAQARLAFIDELLAATENAEARTALDNARTLLERGQ